MNSQGILQEITQDHEKRIKGIMVVNCIHVQEALFQLQCLSCV